MARAYTTSSIQPLMIRCMIYNIADSTKNLYHTAADELWHTNRLYNDLQKLLIDDKQNNCTFVMQKQKSEIKVSLTA